MERGSAGRRDASSIADSLLGGVRVLDLTRASGWLVGKILTDLGAEVVLVEPPGGHPDRALRAAFAALNTGKQSIVVEPGSSRLRELALVADVVLESGDAPLTYEQLGDEASHLIWCALTPFGRTGPKAGWRASDLAVLAQSGNMYLTGDPDRAPLHCTYPTSWYHGGAEAAAGILAALWWRERSGRGQLVDVSMQEALMLASMGLAADWTMTRHRGSRTGATMNSSGTAQREIWPCKGGFISLGLRGGPARIPGLKRLVAWLQEEGYATDALLSRDWDSYNHNTLTQDEVDEITSAFGRFFLTKTMTELWDAALERGLMIAPCNTARELLAGRQTGARELFTEVQDPELGAVRLPRLFMRAEPAPGVRAPAPRLGEHDVRWTAAPTRAPRETPPRAFDGLRVLELGSGAAGPFTGCFFADHGASVVHVESKTRPDFLRIYAITATQKSLDASPMFAQFNRNKLAITLNMKHLEAPGVTRRLVEWADVIIENFAPGTIARFGLSYNDVVAIKPDIVMASTCLHGQTGPEKDYPGFGPQGSAISGFNHLTGWPDREPVGPAGTVTDSLSPRYAAAAVMAGLLYRARTGKGVYLDVSQVECAVHAASEIFAEFAATGTPPSRLGNRAPQAAPHGVFRCAGDDRWIALAAWSDTEWERLVDVMGRPEWATDARFATSEGRLTNVDELEKRLEEWTVTQERDALAERLRDAGLEAVSVADMEDLNRDPQLAHRGHFVEMEHPVLGRHQYETLGFRLSECAHEFRYPGPTLGRDNDLVYKTMLGLNDAEYHRLLADGALD